MEHGEVLVLGGDARYPWMVRCLREKGWRVRTYGVPGMEPEGNSLTSVLEDAEQVILPLKCFREEALVIGQETLEGALLPALLHRDGILLGGFLPEGLEHWLGQRGIRWCSLLEAPGFRAENDAVTAEAALGLILSRLDRCILGAKILVVGWGVLGRALSWRLRALGAEVTVSARRTAHRGEIRAMGMEPDITGEFQRGLQYDVICNTVPAQVIPAGCRGLLIELASLPGGFPPEEDIIVARGLPGEWFPRTAGQQLAQAAESCLTGEGRVLE